MSRAQSKIRRHSCCVPYWARRGVFVLFLFLGAYNACAETLVIRPSSTGEDCVEQFEQVANQLKPGDTLMLHGGRYEQACRRAVSVQGTRDHPITIRAVPGERPVLTRPDSNRETQNNLELIDVEFLTIEGIAFEGGSIGVRLMGETQYFELSHSTIQGTGSAAFTANFGNSSNLYLHNNTVHSTGLGAGPTEGEGFYLGCHDASCRVTQSRIERNVVYNLSSRNGGGNDAIELKPGSGGNRVAHNVVTGRGQADDYPCILSYGGGERVNVIENNTLTGCHSGIYVVQDAIVRGNVVVDASHVGISLRPHRAVGRVSNVSIVNNTVLNNAGGTACLNLSLWRARNVTLLNNALFCRDGIAVQGYWLNRAMIQNTWVNGTLRGVPLRYKGYQFIADRDLPKLDSPIESYALKVFRDVGTASPLVVGSTDIGGKQRPVGAAVDIGAIEQ